MECEQNEELFYDAIAKKSSYVTEWACFVDLDLPIQPVAFEIDFDSHKIFLSVDANDDSILISESLPLIFENELLEKKILKSDYWRSTVGARLCWAWVMINQQGYRDGVQLEFYHELTEKKFNFQLMAIASSLEIRIVNPESWALLNCVFVNQVCKY
jgi:hypothetical protein